MPWNMGDKLSINIITSVQNPTSKGLTGKEKVNNTSLNSNTYNSYKKGKGQTEKNKDKNKEQRKI